MLNWSMVDLANAARLSISTIERMVGSVPSAVSDSAFGDARTALEAAGVRFIFDTAKSEGIWFDHD